MIKKSQSVNVFAPHRMLRLGFVPLTDCAPIVMAHELGLFKKYGLDVVLSRELGWATVRDKIIYGELDAAHALAAMPIAASLGLGSITCDCLTGLVLNLHGNAITLSSDLRKRGVHDGKSLCEQIRRSRRQKIFTFGAVYPYSSHRHLLRRWLASHGIDADRDVRIVIVPPPQMASNLQAGHLDGFCAGEPWNSVAVQLRAGWIAATSAEMEPGHPEKVLMVRHDFAEQRAGQHVAMIAALLDACEFCDAPENRDEIISVLSQPEYVGVSRNTLRHGINGEIDFGSNVSRSVEDFCVFNQEDANEPSSDKAAWALELVRANLAGGATGLSKESSALNLSLARKVFRPEIYNQAVRRRLKKQTHAGLIPA